MLDIALTRHAREFLRYLANKQYDRTDAGLVFPKAGVTAAGVYTHDVNGLDVQEDHNLVVDEGLMAMLSDFLANGTSYPNYFLSVYGGNYTPTNSLTAASYPATAGEITSSTEGYSNTTRPAWTPSAPAANAIDNVANKAAFNIVTASSVTFQGAALHSSSTKGAVDGILVSAAKFSAARVVYNSDVFNLAYRVQLTSS